MSISEKSATSGIKIFIIYVEVILVLLVTYLAYAQVFHEFFHFAVYIISGSEGEIVFGFPSHVECPGILNTNLLVFWLYCMLPYFFLSLLIVLILSIFRFRPNNYYVNLVVISIPAGVLYDKLNNYFRFYARENDVNNLLAVSFSFFLLVSVGVKEKVPKKAKKMTHPFFE